jgi:hypothetical protein
MSGVEAQVADSKPRAEPKRWYAPFQPFVQPVWRAVKWLFRFLRKWIRRFVKFLLWVALIAAVILFIGFVFFRTERDVAYRDASWHSDDCVLQRSFAEILATHPDPEKLNDEWAAIDRESVLATGFGCGLQLHRIPRPEPVKLADGKMAGPLEYHLAFLEFNDRGQPADKRPDGAGVESNQLDDLVYHLDSRRRDGKSNFVIAFIHGWRHDSRIGDSDVQKLRLFAAYTASFLEQRCISHGRDCNALVTAVYFGWRGARVDEHKTKRVLGSWIGGAIDGVFGTIPALLTLFDRKPVSERIGPAAITSLRRIDQAVFDRSPEGWKRSPEGRMVTFGHSLGGNMIAATLRETVVATVLRHEPGLRMSPPFGDLIVLLNPASEAYNWTSIQRAMRERVRFLHTPREALAAEEIQRETKDIQQGHGFFPVSQPPIYISLGAANSWPAGGLRSADGKFLWNLANGRGTVLSGSNPAVARNACEELAQRAEYLDRSAYDRPTHDLFPAFSMDFRPLAETLESMADNRSIVDLCKVNDPTPPDADAIVEERPFAVLYRWIAGFLRNIPFMNTDVEQTRTIGHLHPVRSPIGSLDRGNLLTATVYGTTHELIANLGENRDAKFLRARYDWAAKPSFSECAVVDGWLLAARKQANESGHRNGMYWDSSFTPKSMTAGQSGNLTPVRRGDGTAKTRIENRFRHGYGQAGMAPIVRANDPFWNVRVFETAMQDHGGYDSYPLVCAIMQLVIDKIVWIDPTDRREAIANRPQVVPE